MQENEEQLNEIPNGVAVSFLDAKDERQPMGFCQRGRHLIRRVKLDEAKLKDVLDDDDQLKHTKKSEYFISLRIAERPCLDNLARYLHINGTNDD